MSCYSCLVLYLHEVTQERTPDEKKSTNRTDNSIEKLLRSRRVAAQNADILQRLTMVDE